MTVISKINALIDKSQLQLANKRFLGYGLSNAEKDYFLAIVSMLIFNSKLKEKLVFKGGTALNHCYLNQLRFSEDLDFTSLDKNITVTEVKNILESVDFLKIKKEFVSKYTIKLEKLQYTGPLNLPNSLKVEIDFTQNVLLPARNLEYKNVWGLDVMVKVMDIREICAEKIRAMSDRLRYRDFYDFYQIVKNFDISLDEVLELVKKKEIRETISKEKILTNWQIIKQDQKTEYPRVYYKQNVPEENLQKALEKLPFLQLF